MSMLAARFGNSRTFKNQEPLSNDDLMRYSRSIFAENAHETRSSRYAFIPTIQVVDALRNEGFMPFSVTQAKSRIAGKSEFTKHMLRFRHADQIVTNQEATNEIILINSHDGTSSYQMLSGCFRFVCANGLIHGDKLQDVRIKHAGNVIDNVIEGAYTVLNSFDRVTESREAMAAIELKPEYRQAFANAALQLRYDPETVEAPIRPEQIINPRRSDDNKSDLWTTFNVVQENLIKGGLRGYRTNREGRKERTTTRPVQGIDQSTALNRALWTLGEEMARLLK